MLGMVTMLEFVGCFPSERLDLDGLVSDAFLYEFHVVTQVDEELALLILRHGHSLEKERA